EPAHPYVQHALRRRDPCQEFAIWRNLRRHLLRVAEEDRAWNKLGHLFPRRKNGTQKQYRDRKVFFHAQNIKQSAADHGLAFRLAQGLARHLGYARSSWHPPPPPALST